MQAVRSPGPLERAFKVASVKLVTASAQSDAVIPGSRPGGRGPAARPPRERGETQATGLEQPRRGLPAAPRRSPGPTEQHNDLPAHEPMLEQPATPIAKGWIAIVALRLPGPATGRLAARHRDGLVVRGFLGVVLVMPWSRATSAGGSPRSSSTTSRCASSAASSPCAPIGSPSPRSVGRHRPAVGAPHPRSGGVADRRRRSGQREDHRVPGPDRAYQLRDYLVTRAHGTQTTVAASAERRWPVSSRMWRRRPDDRSGTARPSCSRPWLPVRGRFCC